MTSPAETLKHLMALAHIDPEKALEEAATLTYRGASNAMILNDRRDFQRKILLDLGTRDPERALALCDRATDNFYGDIYKDNIFRLWMERDETAVLRFVRSTKEEHYIELYVRYSGKSSIAEAIQVIELCTDMRKKSVMMHGLLTSWCSESVTFWLLYAFTIPDINLRECAIGFIARHLVKTNRNAAILLLVTIEDSGRLGEAMRDVAYEIDGKSDED